MFRAVEERKDCFSRRVRQRITFLRVSLTKGYHFEGRTGANDPILTQEVVIRNDITGNPRVIIGNSNVEISRGNQVDGMSGAISLRSSSFNIFQLLRL